jgi:hypothetical protein
MRKYDGSVVKGDRKYIYTLLKLQPNFMVDKFLIRRCCIEKLDLSCPLFDSVKKKLSFCSTYFGWSLHKNGLTN